VPELSLSLPPRPESVRAARDRLRELLDSWATEEKRQTVVLLLSEVVTNAVRHAPGPVHVTVTLFRDRVHARIRDGNPRTPQLRAPDETGGRGIELLQRLATRWGVEPHADDGKTVWFEVAEED
jgi:anti-sigma regulatory factor (Ser/Thr protein kinase)